MSTEDESSSLDTTVNRHSDTKTKVQLADDLLVSVESNEAPTLTVIMPTLNEEAGIAECLRKIKDSIAELGITAEIIISDSSTDATPEIARQFGAHVVNPGKPGYGYAYRFAFRHARGEYIVIGDADTTYDFGQIPKLFRLVADGDADIAIGSRLNGEIKPGAMPKLHRYIGNPLLTRFLNRFYNAGVSDAHSGFRVISREALEQLDLQSDGMEFASEMVMDAAVKDMTIAEEPITYHERVGDATLDSFRDGWRHVKFMLINAPGYVLTVPAMVLILIGLAIVTGSILNLEFYTATFGLQTLIGGILFIIVGYQAASLALFSSVVVDPIREQRDPITRAVRDHFTLEGGVVLGLLLVLLGGTFFAYGPVVWVTAGYQAVPTPSGNMVAAMTIVIGIQTLFNSFFLSIIEECRGDSVSIGR